MRSHLGITAILVTMSVFPWVVLGADEDAELAEKVREIDAAFKEPSRMPAGIKGIAELLEKEKLPSRIRSAWLPQLSKAGYHEDAAILAQGVIRVNPDANIGFTMMEFRARELLLAGKGEEALSAAKAAFNVCGIGETERAIVLFVDCMGQSKRLDEAGCRRFRLELAGSSSSTGDAAFKGVVVEKEPFARVLERYRGDSSFKGQLYYGNLLLMTDDAERAKSVFQGLYDKETGVKEKATAAEGIARALRAGSGNMVLANQWLVKIYTPGPNVKADGAIP